jgi:HPt (histidine-containing phosphotransfer) domain-containing protein
MKEMFLENGFDDLLAKPIDISKLDEMLNRWIPKEKKIVSIEQVTMNDEKREEKDILPDSASHSSLFSSPFSLASIPGLDVKKGIAMTGGTMEFYSKVLSMFRKDTLERLPLLQAAPHKLAAPDADTLSLLVTQIHALKSASGSIGATGLFNEAAELEAAGHAGDLTLIHEKLPCFADHLAELVENIRAALEPMDIEIPHPSSPSAPSLYLPQLRELAAALESEKTGDIDRILEEMSKNPLDSKIREILEKISDHVLMAEFNSAQETLGALLDSPGK